MMGSLRTRVPGGHLTDEYRGLKRHMGGEGWGRGLTGVSSRRHATLNFLFCREKRPPPLLDLRYHKVIGMGSGQNGKIVGDLAAVRRQSRSNSQIRLQSDWA